VPLRLTCHQCGGRGESWTEICDRCAGSGSVVLHHVVQVTVPAGVLDGDRFHFTLVPRHHSATRIELLVHVE
jgi:DnaJ-class molecular chaperone